MKKNILLIGGAGYIGTVITKDFLAKNYKITCFDSLIYSQNFCVKNFKKNKNYKFILGDIRNLSNIKNLFKNITDVVILAGLVGDPITKKYPKESRQINYSGVKNIIKECHGQKLNKVIFVSTCSNYGLIKNNIKAKETFKLKPLSNYAKEKVKIESHIMSLKGKVDYSATILRFSTAFGLSPRMRFDLTVNEFVRDICKNTKLIVYDADTWRPYCHVKDFSRLIDIIIKNPKKKTAFQIFNAGDDKNNLTKRMLVKKISKYVKNRKVTFLDHGVDPRNYKVNFSKVEKKLGFKAKFSVNFGIYEIAKFVNSKKFKEFEKKKVQAGNFFLKKNEKK